MADRPSEFGKRRPAQPVPYSSPPIKRSGHVALLMMGTMAVGGGAYALMPRQTCQPNSPGVAATASPNAVTNCTSSLSSGGHGGSEWWSHSSFYSGSSSSSGTSNSASAAETTRGGFGGFARSIAAHFSGS